VLLAIHIGTLLLLDGCWPRSKEGGRADGWVGCLYDRDGGVM